MPMPGRVIEPSLETKLLNIYLYYIGVRTQIKLKIHIQGAARIFVHSL